MQPKISIITVVRNAPQNLELTLNNISSINYPNLELIVIDGASTDSTPEVIERFRNIISYSISEPDQGLYDAMNKGISAATGDYLWFINAGDLVADPEILNLIFTDNNPLQDIYFGDTQIFSSDGKPLGLRRKPLPKLLDWQSLKRGMVVCHQSFIVRRSIAPMYDLRFRYTADIDWVIECLRHSSMICNTGMILSQFSQGGISSRNRRASLKERWQIMVERYGLASTIWAHIRFCVDAITMPKFR